MEILSRVGTVTLLVGGLVLVVLMAYTLMLSGAGQGLAQPGQPASVAGVAVFFPERADWLVFRGGLLVCERRGLVRTIEDSGDVFLVETPRHRHKVRFTWHAARGVRQTQDVVKRMAESANPPIAVVGSINTVLTEALAEALRSELGSGRSGPALLVPWATSVLVDDPGRGPGPVALLDIYPGHTFRYCANNQRQAESVVQCLVVNEAESAPARVYLVVDRHDPYSRDLSDCFHRAIGAAAPRTEIVEQPDVVSPPSPASLLPDVPSPAEREWADSIWQAAHAAPEGRTTWVVLPLQAEPARRLLVALRGRARRGADSGDGPLRVLSGDGVGLDILAELAGQHAYSLWCFSSASVPEANRLPDAEAASDAQIPAEIVSSIIRCLDQPGGPVRDLSAPLSSLVLAAGDPASFGRPIAFPTSGERTGTALGHVLAIKPGRADVLGYAQTPDGTWSAAVPFRPAPVAARL